MSNKFTFNASAIGLGGVITEGSSRVENYCVNGISFSRAETRVIGYETSEDVFTTTTDILLTNLNIRDRLKVALMQATITSTRRMESDDSEFNLHALYRGIELDGEEVEPILDVDLCSGPCGKASTYDDFVKKFGGQISRNAIDSGVENEDLQKALTSNVVPMPGTLVTSTQMRRHGKVVAYPGNRVAVEGLGSAFLGELLVKRGRRRVNLLRFDFGPGNSALNAGAAPVMMALASTDTTGSLTVGSGDGNGEPVWPRH
jgi:hypothetical protein